MWRLIQSFPPFQSLSPFPVAFTIPSFEPAPTHNRFVFELSDRQFTSIVKTIPFCFFFCAKVKEQSVNNQNYTNSILLIRTLEIAQHIVCRRQRPLARATPTTTWRTPSPLHTTGSLATLSTMPAAPADAECGARGGTLHVPTDSGKPVSHGTSARRLPQQTQLVWPFFGAQPAPDTCVLSSSWQPPTPRRHCLIKVVSSANCAPPNSGSPSATISSRRASAGFGAARSMSRIITFVVTRAPPTRIHVFPKPPPLRILLGSDHENQVDGHTGSCAWKGAEGDADVVTTRHGRVQGQCE